MVYFSDETFDPWPDLTRGRWPGDLTRPSQWTFLKSLKQQLSGNYKDAAVRVRDFDVRGMKLSSAPPNIQTY